MSQRRLDWTNCGWIPWPRERRPRHAQGAGAPRGLPSSSASSPRTAAEGSTRHAGKPHTIECACHWHLVLAALCSCQGRRDDTRPRVGRGGGLHSTGPLVAVGRGRGGRAGRGWVLCRVAHKVATGVGKSETWREKLGDHGRQSSSPLGGWGPSAHVNQRGWGHYENWLLHGGGSTD